MSKHTERTAQTKQKLIDSFWELYCEKNIEKITVKAITDNAGFYRSTFYEYFSDVYEVLEEIESILLSQQQEVVNKIYETNNIFDAQKLALDFFESNADHLAVLLGPNGDHNYLVELKRLISKTVREKLQIEEDDLKLQIFFEVLSNSAIGLLNYWYQNRETITLQETFFNGMDILQHGSFEYMKEYNVPFMKEKKIIATG